MIHFRWWLASEASFLSLLVICRDFIFPDRTLMRPIRMYLLWFYFLTHMSIRWGLARIICSSARVRDWLKDKCVSSLFSRMRLRALRHSFCLNHLRAFECSYVQRDILAQLWDEAENIEVVVGDFARQVHYLMLSFAFKLHAHASSDMPRTL